MGRSMTGSSATFVLVPGAWHGAWAWHPVARRLRAAGHRAVSLTPPGLGDGDPRAGVRLSDAVAQVVAEVKALDPNDVVLVGHSWGGYPITGAAHEVRDRVSAVVYFNALVPAVGVPLAEENQEYAAMIRGMIEASPDGSAAILREQAPLLLPGLSDDAHQLLFELLQPQPGAYFLDALDVPDVVSIGLRAAYVLSEDDGGVLARPGQEFAARLGLTPVMVPGGHDAMLTHPDELAAALLTVAAASS